MPCRYVKTRPPTVRDVLRDDPEAARLYLKGPRDLDEIVFDGSEGWMCGEELRMELCRCGYDSEYLCDFPIGDGRTCDIALCGECRTTIGEDLDLCRVHRGMWSKGGP